MKKKIQRYKNVFIVLVLSLSFVLLISLTSNREKVSFAEDGVAVPINGIQSVVFRLSSGISEGIETIGKFSKLKDENDELNEKIADLQIEINKLNVIKKDYEDLKKMLNYKDTHDEYEYIGCEITNISGNSYFEGFVINRGSLDGIEKRMVAISPNGLVGQVTAVGTTWARIQTLANENIAVAGYIDETEEVNGIVKGYKDYDNKVLAKVEVPTLDSDLKKGDTVYTSGVGDVYPKGIKIGKIIEVYEDKSKVVKYGIIEPSVQINKIDKLYIIVPKKNREYDE
ncbi:rod shape-determining protein MreC [Oceanirhabdus sp. W0125-5]|uniref:rod shape-determining protein MreC n=1 Tax=Oceanirhabdus sp. W0125-5 TaxID=2999116 RepID=UPI0022F2CD0C|nr:rod shape-determining protein MreC [Oceanirhabdus sp. W0125-5]WBW95866.1 rod shape-determining protein MreC [Oceanirhabdus sp. W0125-5]